MELSFRFEGENYHTFDIEKAWFNFGEDTLHLTINGREAYALLVNGFFWTINSPVYFKGKEHTGIIDAKFKSIINPLFNH